MTDNVRLIDANGLIEDFKNDLINGFMEGLRGNPQDSILITNVIERIQDAPTIEIDNWTNVKDRLPKTDGEYMVWHKHKGKCEICEFNTDSQTFGFAYEDYDEMYSTLLCWDDGLNQFVTHWQPVPKPPKDGEQK